MKRFLSFIVAAGVMSAATIASASALDAQPVKKLSGNLKIDGSSTVYPITEAVVEEFKKTAEKVNITVGISGTGGGFKKFGAGEIDIADASRPIKKEEHDKAVEGKIEYIELPVAYDGLSIIVNKKNTWVDKLTLDELKKLFTTSGSAKSWKDVRSSFPDRPVKLFAPGTDSGTFDYFKEVIATKEAAIRADMSVSEDDNVLVKGVEGDEGAVAFLGYAYYVENKDKLKVVPIDAGKGAIAPNHDTITDGTYAPFSRPLFIYVNKKAASRAEVKAFVEFYLDKVSDVVDEVGYVQIPSEVISRARANFKALKTGTQYTNDKGEKVSGPLEKVYK
ncbi:MAG: PstS family phosphate ABC transporter substrate-binding protein [Pyrinomonadaceae bacterium]|nr:PstS family phosphate ABC transporter substrate-binding protein [Phycisphaerales bacterium]